MKKDISLFVLLSVIASALNYFIYPILSRILPSNEYVDITVALSLFTQMSTFLSSIIAITIGISKQGTTETKERIQALQSFLFKAFMALAIVFLVLSPLVTEKIHVSVLFVIPILLMMFFSIPVTVISGYLNGLSAMKKLGLVAVISASTQFVIAISTASITHSAVVTMATMSIAQLLTIFIIYRLFSTLKLPSISSPFKQSNKQFISKRMMVYTAFAAVSIMIVSLAQIADLLILQNTSTTDIKFYTDIYVVSRIVFFAGMILIWPFLGQIHVSSISKNFYPFLRLVILFLIIGISAVIGLATGGDVLMRTLFNVTYDAHEVLSVGVLSILFKIFMLIITAATLYFMVLHRYIVVAIAAVCGGTLILYDYLVSDSTSTLNLLTHLNFISGIIAILLVVIVLTEARFKK